MIRKKFLVPLLVGILLALTVTTAYAVIWGEKDGDDHPYVGLIVFDVDGRPAFGSAPPWNPAPRLAQRGAPPTSAPARRPLTLRIS